MSGILEKAEQPRHMSGWKTFLLAAATLAPASAIAQAGPETAVEGYVFDVATKKPLANVIVTVRSAFPSSDGAAFVAQVTNASGFYQLATAIDPAATTTVEADCRTSKAVVAATLPLYTPARPIVYRRDFYLSLPKRAKGCVLP